MTFSIVAFDPATGDLGVSVASACLAVGAGVAWARAGVGAVVTQAAAQEGYGPGALDLLSDGLAPAEALRRLTAADPEAARRQVGVVDARGRAAAFTGGACEAWAGDAAGRGVACQGNLLTGAGTVRAMARALRAAPGDLAARLLAALAAGGRRGASNSRVQGSNASVRSGSGRSRKSVVGAPRRDAHASLPFALPFRGLNRHRPPSAAADESPISSWTRCGRANPRLPSEAGRAAR